MTKLNTIDLIRILQTVELRDFTKSDWDAFAGCESANPRIGQVPSMSVIDDAGFIHETGELCVVVDGDSIQIFDEDSDFQIFISSMRAATSRSSPSMPTSMTNAQMTPNRFGRWAQARRLVNKIQANLLAGNTVTVATALRATHYTKPGHAVLFKSARNGAYVQRGKSWDCIDGCSIRFFGTKIS